MKSYGKSCRKCNVILDVNNTYPSKARRGDNICKSCHLIEQRKFYHMDAYYHARERLYTILGSICKHCGFKDVRALQIDHIKNNGYEELKKYGYKRMLQRTLKMSEEEIKENYQILCANCNWIKRREVRSVLAKIGQPDLKIEQVKWAPNTERMYM